MDEFDKIRELSEDLSNRKEPVFTGFNQPKEPSFHEIAAMREALFEKTQQPEPVNVHNQQEPQRVIETFERREVQTEASSFNFVGAPEEEISFEPLTQDTPEKELPNMRFHIVFISLLLIALVLSLVGFFMFRMENADSDEIATITASQEAVKEAPEQAGGMNIPDQDKLVYNRIRTDSVTTKVESLFPEPEKPVLPQILAIEQNAPEEDFVSMNEVEAVDPLQSIAVPAVGVGSNTNIAKVEDVISLPQIEKPKLQVQPKQEEVIDQKPKKEVITLAPVTLPESATKVEKVPFQEGVWRVQLFASNNKEAVEKAWKRIETTHNKLLSNMSYLIKKVEIKGKGAFYRLQVGQFPTREMADGLCSKLKAKKQDCIPIK